MAATYELSFAGLPFRIPAPDLRAKVEAHLRLGEVLDVLNPNPLPEQWLGWLPDGPSAPTPRLYEMFYPWGARRFGAFRGLMAKAEVDALPKLISPGHRPVDPEGYQNAPAPFVLYTSASDVPVQTNLYLLPPRPLTGVEGVTDLFLVTLVDERYFWRWRDVNIRSAPKYNDQDGTQRLEWQHTWATVFDACKAALGITLDYGSIDAGYGKPDPNSPLNQYRGSVAASLDYACVNTGRVLCRSFDGTYTAQKLTDANTAADAAHQAAVRAFGGQLWTAAGAFDNTPTEPFAPALNRPQVVRVISGHWDTKAANNRVFDPTGPTDDRPDFGDGEDLDSFGTAFYPTKGSLPSNFAVVLREEGTNPPQTIGDFIGKDFYDWNARGLDCTYRGVVAFDPKAGLDAIYTYDAPATRVYRDGFNWEFVRFSHWDGTQLTEYPRTASLQVVSVDPSNGVPKCKVINPTDSVWPLDKEYGDVYCVAFQAGQLAPDPRFQAFPPGVTFGATFFGVLDGKAYYTADPLLQSTDVELQPQYPQFGGLVKPGHQYLGQGTKYFGGLGFLPKQPASPYGWVDHGLSGFGLNGTAPPFVLSGVPMPPNVAGPPRGGVLVGGDCAAGLEHSAAKPQAVVAGALVLARADTGWFEGTSTTWGTLYWDGFNLWVGRPMPSGGFGACLGGTQFTAILSGARGGIPNSPPWPLPVPGYQNTPGGLTVDGMVSGVGFATGTPGGTAVLGRSRIVPSWYGLSPPSGGDPYFGIPMPPPDNWRGGLVFVNGLYVGGDIPWPGSLPAGNSRLVSAGTRFY